MRVRNFSASVMALAVVFFTALPSAHAALIGIVPSYPDITTNGSDINYAWTAGVGGTLTINGNAGLGTPPAQANQTVKFSSADITHNIYGCSTLGISTTTCAPPNSTNSFYSLSANFNASGAFTGGTLTILGYVDATSASGYQAYDWNGAAAGGAPTGTLLTASLSGFGFNGSAGTSTHDLLSLDFSYILTGGDFFTGGYSGNGVKFNNAWVYSASSTAPVGGAWSQSAFTTQSFGCGNGNTAKPCYATMDTYVPVPAAVWLFGSGLVGLLGFAGRSRKARAG